MRSPQSPETNTTLVTSDLSCGRCEAGVPSYLLLAGFGLQDVLFPDGVEHAAFPTKVSETLLLIVPVHLQDDNMKKPSAAVHVSRAENNQ